MKRAHTPPIIVKQLKYIKQIFTDKRLTSNKINKGQNMEINMRKGRELIANKATIPKIINPIIFRLGCSIISMNNAMKRPEVAIRNTLLKISMLFI
ncbi:MAG: hypothetical protein GQ574_11345 [Crocinitomix sp.]|nr:hypothetical protein [Crocinitomix sp.]